MKIRMNLLPYREARRKEARQRFWIIIGIAAGVALLAVGIVHIVIAGYIAAQDSRNEFITAKKENLENSIKEIATLRENIDAVKAQQDIIGRLQSDRAAPTHLLDQMVRLVPDGMFINSLKQKDSDVTVSGMAASSENVSTFMVSIQNSAFLSKPELIEIKSYISKEGRRMQQFSLKFVLLNVRNVPAEEKVVPTNSRVNIEAGVSLVPTMPIIPALPGDALKFNSATGSAKVPK